LYLLAKVAFIAVYEIGYIENDTVTIKKESTPNMRLYAKDYAFFEHHYNRVILSRVGAVVLALVGLWGLSALLNVTLYLFPFVLTLLAARAIFAAHNTIRNRFNVVTFAGLSILKYSALLFLFVPLSQIATPFVLAVTIFPLLRTTEHACRERYGFVWLQRVVGDLDAFRVKYYSTLLVLALLFYVWVPNELFFSALLMHLYYLLYRVGCYIAVYRGNYKRVKRNPALQKQVEG
jgi:hypothetical protein